jgi:adenine C2-methylase RlmN of 23S rRNA A2503 and tRNA A37
VRRWLFGRRAESFADMTDLPAAVRADLEAAFALWTTSIAAYIPKPNVNSSNN